MVVVLKTTERWRPVPMYEGLYEVSTRGRVRSLDRKVNGRNCTYIRSGRVLKQKTDKDGYRQVGLTVDGVVRSFQVHRLVALAFIHNMDDDADKVNHKDLDKSNNQIWNLEWCTHQENMTHWRTNRVAY